MTKQPTYELPYELRLQRVLQDAITAWPQLDLDPSQATDAELYINGADMIEWFSKWRQTAIAALKGQATDLD
jgi:hypothetical protein